MQIAIHYRPNSFAERWINYCKRKDIPFKIVNCFDSNIIQQLKGFDVLLWHHHQSEYKDIKVAHKVLFALEQAGVKVFPNFNTSWHFDDKIAQKYLLESLEVPTVPSYVFYEKKEAIAWAKSTSYPKVFKLKGGASSSNVSLVYSSKSAINKINRAFGKGFSLYNRWGGVKEAYRKYRKNKTKLKGLLWRIKLLFTSQEFAKQLGNEKDYVYFQEFIPNNTFDIRVIVIGGRAFALKRMVRENDFRASGSGKILYDKAYFDDGIIKLSFEINEKIKSKSCALDFVIKDDKSLLVEISYGFASKGYDRCVGYWDRSLNFHEGNFNPYGWMIESVINKV